MEIYIKEGIGLEAVDFIHRAIDKYLIQLDEEFDKKNLKGKFDEKSKRIKFDLIVNRQKKIKNDYRDIENNYKKNLREIRFSIKEINSNINLVMEDYKSQVNEDNISEKDKEILNTAIELKDKILSQNNNMAQEIKSKVKDIMNKAKVDMSLRKINIIIEMISDYKEQISKLLLNYNKKSKKIGYKPNLEAVIETEALPLFENIESYVMKYFFKDSIYDKEWLLLNKSVIKGIDIFKKKIDELIEQDNKNGYDYLLRQAYDNNVSFKMIRFKMQELKKIKVNLVSQYENLKSQYDTFIQNRDNDIIKKEKFIEVLMDEYNKEIESTKERLANPYLTDLQKDFCNDFLIEIKDELDKIIKIFDLKIEAQ